MPIKLDFKLYAPGPDGTFLRHNFYRYGKAILNEDMNLRRRGPWDVLFLESSRFEPTKDYKVVYARAAFFKGNYRVATYVKEKEELKNLNGEPVVFRFPKNVVDSSTRVVLHHRLAYDEEELPPPEPDELIKITAEKPTRHVNMIKIPLSSRVEYRDITNGQYELITKPEIQLTVEEDHRVIKPVLKGQYKDSSKYVLTNENVSWLFGRLVALPIYPEWPKYEDGILTIPPFTGTSSTDNFTSYPYSYYNEETGEKYEDGSTHELKVNTTVVAKMNEEEINTGDGFYLYIPDNIDSRWKYKPRLDLRYKTAPSPEINFNTITIPPMEGVKYTDQYGKSYGLRTVIDKDVKITVRIDGEQPWVLLNDGQTWEFIYHKDEEGPQPGKPITVAVKPLPGRENGTIQIPDNYPGVSYYLHLGTSGKHKSNVGGLSLGALDGDYLVIEAIPDPGYILTGQKKFILDYRTQESELIEVEAPRPIQKGNFIEIPSYLDGFNYYLDGYTEEDSFLTGTIELTDKLTTIVAIPDEGFVIKGEDQYSFLKIDTEDPTEKPLVEVRATVPSFSKNIITIPSHSPGFRYYLIPSGGLLRPGEIQVNETLTIEARPEKGFTLVGETVFTFKFEEAVEDETLIVVTAAMPTQSQNTLTIPSNITGINYFYKDTSEKVDGQKITLTGEVVIEAKAIEGYRITGQTIFKYHPETIVATVSFYGKNASLIIGGGTSIREGETINIPKGRTTTFTIKADEGYFFDRYGTITQGDVETQIKANSASDKTRAHFSTILTTNALIYMNATKVQEEEETETLGFNNLYIASKEKLTSITEDIMELRRTYDPNGGITTGVDPWLVSEPHSYIINTLSLPFTIDEDLIGNKQPVQLGYTTLTPTAPKVLKDLIRKDLGTINVPYKHYNAYDYKETTTVIHLPYSEPIIIDNNYAIGQRIDIEYVIDLYSGETTINLKSSFTEGKVFHSTRTKIGNHIPFITARKEEIVGSLNLTQPILNNNTPIPYIEVVRHRQYQKDSPYNAEAQTTVQSLANTKGHIKVNNITLDIDTTTDEIQAIKNILASGVHIK